MKHNTLYVLSLANNYAVSRRLSDTLCTVCVGENMAFISNAQCHMFFRIHPLGTLKLHSCSKAIYSLDRRN